jgi:hypothetical protein
MTQEQALSVLIQAVRIAQSKGAFTLEDAKTVAEAVSVFVPAQNAEQATEVKTEQVEAEVMDQGI